MKPITWSYSSLALYQQCPKKYYHLKVAKDIKEELGEAIIFGNEIHKIAEEYVSKDKPIPEKYRGIEPALKALKDMEGEKLCENKLGLTIDFEPCGFFDKKVWWRGVADIIILQGDTILTVDYKTGKPTPDSAQLRLTAAMTFAHKPYIDKVVNAFLWLKIKDEPPTTEVITRDEVSTIWQEFAPRVQRLEYAVAENKFPPRPSGLCRKWCPVGKTLCEHCGE